MTTQPAEVSFAGPRNSWQPDDLTLYLNDGYRPPEPTVGARTDGVGLFYPGRSHLVIGETEAMKTWLALAAALTEIRNKNSVVYIDFEDDGYSFAARLHALQLDDTSIRERFAYIRPDQPITNSSAVPALRDTLNDLQPTLVVLDGITAAMALHGYDPLSNKDFATFTLNLTDKIVQTGPAVVSLDHVTKNREDRGRYALGAVHKLNGLTGACFVLDNRDALTVGATGRSTITISKDRPGQLRQHAVRSTGGSYTFGDLIVESHAADFVEATITPPSATNDFRPTVLMTRVSEALHNAAEPLSQRGIYDRVHGRQEDIRKAIACLIDDHYVTTKPGPRGSTLHTLNHPYKEAQT